MTWAPPAWQGNTGPLADARGSETGGLDHRSELSHERKRVAMAPPGEAATVYCCQPVALI